MRVILLVYHSKKYQGDYSIKVSQSFIDMGPLTTRVNAPISLPHPADGLILQVKLNAFGLNYTSYHSVDQQVEIFF